jgi:osmotically-inducible protein OsmY
MGKTHDIREAVEAELKYDPLIDPADITVMNINGDVALSGTVPSYPQYLATTVDGNVTLTGVMTYGRQRETAELAVSGLTGVRNVRDEIDISFDADPVDVTVLVQAALDRNALI